MTASAPARIGLYCHGDRITQREALALAAHPAADAWALVPYLIPGLLTVKRRDQITREEDRSATRWQTMHIRSIQERAKRWTR